MASKTIVEREKRATAVEAAIASHGDQVDFGRWADELKPPLEELESALDEVAREVRRAERTKKARDRAAADFDRAYQAVAGAVEALSRLAGLDGYAERLRPSG